MTPRLAGRGDGRLRLVAVVIVVLLVAAACSGRTSPGPSTSATPSPAAAAASPAPSSGPVASPPSAPPSPVVGVVTHIDATGLAAVSGFTLRTATGTVLDFTIGTLENGAQFPPGHLAEHQATAEPVRVSFRSEGGKLVAYRIEDAATPAAS